MISSRTDSRVRRLQRRPWSRSLASALGGGILIDAPTIAAETHQPAAERRMWIPQRWSVTTSRARCPTFNQSSR
jgi:hypothetical protein